ncbi:MAG: DNA-protecting protein DprA [Chitinophagaceae bacterium]|nr:DNA-protecting protein DprA [Chitinophagaceae bacterium]
MQSDLLYQLALTQVPHVGYVHAKILALHFGSAAAVFQSKRSLLEKIEGIGEIRAGSIKAFRDFKKAEDEIAFIEKYGIKPFFITDKEYPQRLLNCYDPPTMLFYKGNADLNASRVIAIVGTRTNTDYGKLFTEKLIKDLASSGILIISGLAFGIDAIAHKAALKNKLTTIGVLGHGLDTMYPAEHAGLAKDMAKHGGLLTEFRSKTKPDKHNFPSRNRVVAGLCDATIVVETGIKGGSMITAEIANGYNRDVFAVPGRNTDPKSGGCNYLIGNNKAILLTDAQQFLEIMGWDNTTLRSKKNQKELFIELTNEEKIITNLLQEKENVSIDELVLKSGCSSSTLAATILNLELKNVILSLPGKMYKLL